MGARGENPGAGKRGHFRQFVGRAGSGQIKLRVLAPVSILVFFVVLVVVVIASVGGDSGSNNGGRDRAGERPPRQQVTRERPTPRPGRRIYVVRPGDTLATIAEKTGVGVPALVELNPTIDPRTLVTGQRIKLR